MSIASTHIIFIKAVRQTYGNLSIGSQPSVLPLITKKKTVLPRAFPNAQSRCSVLTQLPPNTFTARTLTRHRYARRAVPHYVTAKPNRQFGLTICCRDGTRTRSTVGASWPTGDLYASLPRLLYNRSRQRLQAEVCQFLLTQQCARWGIWTPDSLLVGQVFCTNWTNLA